MGASFNSLTLTGSKAEVRADFRELQDRDRHENGHSYSGGIGMANGLEFINKTFDTVDEADDWLMERCQKWEPALAVKVGDAYRIGAWCSS